MGQRYTFNHLWIIIIAVAISMNLAFVIGPGKQARADTIYTRKAKKPSYFKNGLPSGTIPQVKTNSIPIRSVAPTPSDKILMNVQVSPNTITDQLIVKYVLSRNSNVTFKIVDVLGNNVMVYSERVESGERQFTRNFDANKLTSGFYFLRVVAGTESVIKRITVL